tara:strand:+ start:417 stop:1448 length:1032 start_codon:yes stop_codon:yes gene_type:complete
MKLNLPSDLAKYPFLDEAGHHVKKYGAELRDLENPEYANILEKAKLRITNSLLSTNYKYEIMDPDSELLSFPISLLIVKAVERDYITSKFLYSEALKVEKFLEDEKLDIIAQIFKNTLNITLHKINYQTSQFNEFDFYISISDYLKWAATFHELEWKLINRLVHSGSVYLSKHDLIRLIQNAIKSIIRKKLDSIKLPELPEKLNAIVLEINQKFPSPISYSNKFDIPADKYPPCVKHALQMIDNHENLPHFGRFSMTTYLLNIGKSVDEIIQLYPKVPDFNERITRYQVEHLAGLQGSRTKYKTPSCKNIITHNFCFKIKECNGIKNPLQFGRNYKKRSRLSK